MGVASTPQHLVTFVCHNPTMSTICYAIFKHTIVCRNHVEKLWKTLNTPSMEKTLDYPPTRQGKGGERGERGKMYIKCPYFDIRGIEKSVVP